MQGLQKVYARGDALLAGVITLGGVCAGILGFVFENATTAALVAVPLVLAALVLATFARGSLLNRIALPVLVMAMVALHIHLAKATRSITSAYSWHWLSSSSIATGNRSWRVRRRSRSIT